MACIFMDGFEIDFADNTIGIWDNIVKSNPVVNFYYTSANARTGNGCLMYSGPSNDQEGMIWKTLPSTYTELYFGFSIYISSTPAMVSSGGTQQYFFRTLSSTAFYQISCRFDITTRIVYVYRDNTLLGTGVIPLVNDVQHYFEIRIVVHDSTGIIQTKVNGTLDINLSGIDTNTGGGNIESFAIGFFSNTLGSVYFDDVMVNDTTGTISNSWPDGAGIELLTPSANGTHSDWTSTGGANDASELDEWGVYGGLADGDTTSISSATTNQRTSVQLTNTTLAGEVRAVMLLSEIRTDGAGLDQMAQSLRISGADYDQTAFAPSISYDIRTDILTLNPATAAQWLTAEIDAMEQGVLRVT